MIERAIELAERNDRYPRWRLAAVIVKGGSVLSHGISVKRNDPLCNSNGEGCSEHAEINAMRQCSADRLQGAVIYVARITRGGRVALAKPCKMCEDALRTAGVKRAIYTQDETTIRRMKI